MASRSIADGGNNCPTSNRDGYCVTAEQRQESVREGFGGGGEIFMPDTEDIKARDARAARFAAAEGQILDDDSFDIAGDDDAYNTDDDD